MQHRGLCANDLINLEIIDYRSLWRLYTVLHQSTAASWWRCGPRPLLGWVEMAVGLPEGPSYPGHPLTQTIFSLRCPVNDHRKAAFRLSKIGRLRFLFSYLFPSLFLLIIILLVISGNVHPSFGPIFSVQCVLEMWPGEVGWCNAAPPSNRYI